MSWQIDAIRPASFVAIHPTRRPGHPTVFESPCSATARSYPMSTADGSVSAGSYSRERYISSENNMASLSRATSTISRIWPAVASAPVALCAKLTTMAFGGRAHSSATMRRSSATSKEIDSRAPPAPSSSQSIFGYQFTTVAPRLRATSANDW